MLQGHLRKRGKYYSLVIRLQGKLKWIALKTDNRHEAERMRRSRLREIEKNFMRDIKKSMFRELADKWSAYLETSGLKERTVENYKQRLRVHILPYFGGMMIQDITPDVIEDFKVKWCKEVKAKTLNYDLLVLSMIFDKGIVWGYCFSNPIEHVDRLKPKKREFKTLTREEVGKLLAATEGQHRAILMVAVMSGLRQAELLAMRWKNLDWENETYIVRESLTPFGFDTPKNEGSIRTVPLPKLLVKELKRQKARQNEWRLQAGEFWNNDDLIFSNPLGEPINASHLTHQIFYPALKRSKVTKVRFHDLRGTAATLALEGGATVKAVQNLLGHSTARLTLEVYAKASTDGMKDLATKLESYLEPQKPGLACQPWTNVSKMLANGVSVERHTLIKPT